ncbi:MAG: PqqD family protein [Eubacteriales bacterium]|nr:PqqD family protein [Eubacteriales bacterium]
MRIKKGFAKREIAGSNIVVPVGKNSLEFNGMITLNDSGSFFWDCLCRDTTIDEVVEKVTAEYDVDAQRARKDVEAFVKMLEDNNLLEK